MEGGHAEDALAMGGLEVGHLDDVGERLDDVDDAHQDEDQGHIQGKGHAAHRAAQEEGAGVAHEHFCRIVVIHQKAHKAPEQGRGKHGHARRPRLLPLHPGPAKGGGKEGAHRQGHGAGQTVQAVGDVHGVHGAGDDQHGEDEVDHPGQVQLHPKEGHIEVGGQDAAFPQQDDEQDGRRQLEQELLPGGQARVLFLFDLGVVVQKADGPKDQGKDQDDHARPIPG